MKTLKTNRKFYNKWLYKVSLIVEGSGIFRFYPLDQIVEKLKESDHKTYHAHYIVGKAQSNKNQIQDLTTFFLTLDSSTWTKRLEGNLLDFYTNDRKIYEDISNYFHSSVFHRFEPDENSINLLDESKTIVCEKLPHNKYLYRAYLLPHKMAGDRETKQKYLDWLISQKPKITCTPAVQKWFIKTEWNWDRRYVLVEDDYALLMLKLRNSDVVGSIYKYVISDK